MKKLTLICLCLFILTACAAHKPIASPEEVNEYLDTLCHVSADFGYTRAFDGVDRVEMHRGLAGMLVGE